MNRKCLSCLFAATTILGSTLSVLPLTASQATAANTKEQLLVQLGLQQTKCTPGVVVIWIGNEPACAISNTNYPAGTYRLNPNDFSIVPVGEPPRSRGSRQSGVNSREPQNGGVNVINVVNQPPVGSSTVYPPTSIPSVQSPWVLATYNPTLPVSPAVMARINAAFASQGLQSATCSANPVAVFAVSGQYTACAFPSTSFPAGNYRLDIPGLY